MQPNDNTQIGGMSKKHRKAIVFRDQRSNDRAPVALIFRMSGFEVAGVVLGALPLLIEGLKAYTDGVEAIQNAWNYDIVIWDLLVSLNTGLAIYRSSCEELLTSLVLQDEDFYELLSDPYGEKWKDKAINAQLRVRLGDNLDPYHGAVKRLKKRIHLFQKKLYLDNDYKVDHPTNFDPKES